MEFDAFAQMQNEGGLVDKFPRLGQRVGELHFAELIVLDQLVVKIVHDAQADDARVLRGFQRSWQ